MRILLPLLLLLVVTNVQAERFIELSPSGDPPFEKKAESCEKQLSRLNAVSEAISRVKHPAEKLQMLLASELLGAYRCADDLTRSSENGTIYQIEKDLFGSGYECEHFI